MAGCGKFKEGGTNSYTAARRIGDLEPSQVLSRESLLFLEACAQQLRQCRFFTGEITLGELNPKVYLRGGKKTNIQRQGVLHHCQVLDVAIKKKKLHPVLTSD